MKEATGELNMVVIVVLIVAVLLSFFYTVIWPMLKENTDAVTKCNQAVCDTTKSPKNDGTVRCMYEGKELYCIWKG